MVSNYVLGLTGPVADNISGNVVGVALGNVFRYFAYRYIVFNAPRSTDAGAGDTETGTDAAERTTAPSGR